MVASDPARPGAPPALGTYLVHVLRAGRRELVEFEFAVNGRDLALELVLPLRQFRDFCWRYGAAVSIDEGATDGFWDLLSREGAKETAAGARRTGGEP